MLIFNETQGKETLSWGEFWIIHCINNERCDPLHSKDYFKDITLDVNAAFLEEFLGLISDASDSADMKAIDMFKPRSVYKYSLYL